MSVCGKNGAVEQEWGRGVSMWGRNGAVGCLCRARMGLRSVCGAATAIPLPRGIFTSGQLAGHGANVRQSCWLASAAGQRGAAVSQSH